VRDAGTQFFFETVPAGRYAINYEMIVAHEGDFTSGPASLECMYRPEVNAYSNGIRVTTSK
jgi:alpha-2-macroglobulin